MRSSWPAHSGSSIPHMNGERQPNVLGSSAHRCNLCPVLIGRSRRTLPGGIRPGAGVGTTAAPSTRWAWPVNLTNLLRSSPACTNAGGDWREATVSGLASPVSALRRRRLVCRRLALPSRRGPRAWRGLPSADRTASCQWSSARQRGRVAGHHEGGSRMRPLAIRVVVTAVREAP